MFDRRLLVVAGKGGVGKTTVACALGFLAAERGKKTLIAEVDGAGRAATLLSARPAAVGEAREVHPSLSVMSVEGSAALAEYLQIIVPLKRVLQAVFASRIYQYFVAAAPGLKELMTIGKIWYEAERTTDADGARRWDLVILDAPATGHSLQYLGMPRAAHEVFRTGLVGRESEKLIDLLSDPKRTQVHLVTTAEEMPVNETLEMYEKVRAELGMPLGHLFVNRVHQSALTSADVARLQEALPGAGRDDRRLAREVLERAREEVGWAAINRLYQERLAAAVDLPTINLPFLFSQSFGFDEIKLLAGQIAAVAPAGAAGRRAGAGSR
jgi:anion-transporting  ArsA/GET3 family ATPase